MHTEYEMMVKEFLPALRAKAARVLSEKYQVNQMKIASMLDTTQAAVSKYLSGKYSDKVKEFEATIDEKEVDEFVKSVMKESRYDAQKHVCKMCARNLSFKCGLMIK